MRVLPIILVVDDDAATTTFLAIALEEAEYDVLAATGEEALRLARERMPALALLDRRMPGLDGPELARRLRADPATAAMPLVLMTADVRDVDGWLAKPFSLATLFATVARWAPLL